MKKFHNKQLQNIICSVIAIVMIFGVIATVAYAEVEEPDAFQKVVLQVISLTEGKRVQFVDEVLEVIDTSNYKDYVDDAKTILGVSMTDSDMKKVLESYVNYPDTYKSEVKNLIKVFQLPEGMYDTAAFSDIEGRINFNITGDSSDSRGFKLFVEIFKTIRTFNMSPVFYDGSEDIYKIDIKVDGNFTLKNEIDALVTSVKSLKDKGVKNFDDFVDNIETEINTNSYAQIYSLKTFLKDELGSSAYEGILPVPSEIDPLQKVVLTVINLPQNEKNAFINNILVELTSDNYTEYVYEAKRLLGVSISDAEIKAAFKVYTSYSAEYRAQIEGMLRSFNMQAMKINTANYADLAADINLEVTGDAEDVIGTKFVVGILNYLSTFTGAMVFDGAEDVYKVDFSVPNNSTMKQHLDGLIKLIKSLEDRGVTDFESFLAVAEDIVNANDNIQIYNFKKQLSDLYGKSVYDGTLPYPSVAPSPSPTSGGSGGSSGSGGSGGGSGKTPTPSPTPSTEVVEPTPSEMPAAPFNDVAGHWAEEFITKLAARNIVSGYPDGSIRPDIEITRAEMSVIAVKAAGLEPVKEVSMTFADADKIPEWAAGYVQAGVEAGIIAGYEDNTFRAAQNLTREEMVVLIMKAFEYGVSENPEFSFIDADDIGAWSEAFVAKSVELEFVVGYPDNTFKPKKSVTRAEAFTVLIKAIEEKEAAEATEETTGEVAEEATEDVEETSTESDLEESSQD